MRRNCMWLIIDGRTGIGLCDGYLKCGDNCPRDRQPYHSLRGYRNFYLQFAGHIQ